MHGYVLGLLDNVNKGIFNALPSGIIEKVSFSIKIGAYNTVVTTITTNALSLF